MGCLGNALWFLCCGLYQGLAWCLAGALWCVTLVGIPVGLQCFKLAGLSFFPFGKEHTHILPLEGKVLRAVQFRNFCGRQTSPVHKRQDCITHKIFRSCRKQRIHMFYRNRSGQPVFLFHMFQIGIKVIFPARTSLILQKSCKRMKFSELLCYSQRTDLSFSNPLFHYPVIPFHIFFPGGFKRFPRKTAELHNI